MVADSAWAVSRAASFNPHGESSFKTQALFQEQAFQPVAVFFAHVLASVKTLSQARTGSRMQTGYFLLLRLRERRGLVFHRDIQRVSSLLNSGRLAGLEYTFAIGFLARRASGAFQHFYDRTKPLLNMARSSEAFKIQDRMVEERILRMAKDPSPQQRLPVPLKRKVMEFADILARGRHLTVLQCMYARILIDDYDTRLEAPTFNPLRHAAVVSRMRKMTEAERQRLTYGEQRFIASLLQTAVDYRQQLTRPQLDYAEKMLDAIPKRQEFHDFLDGLFDQPLAEQRDRVPELIAILDRLLQQPWASPLERARFSGFLNAFNREVSSDFDDQFLKYLEDRSPMREDVLYQDPRAEKYLVSQLVRMARRKPEAVGVLQQALLHRGGLRLVSWEAGHEALKALARIHKQQPPDARFLADLRNTDRLSRLYPWWTEHFEAPAIEDMIQGPKPAPVQAEAPLRDFTPAEIIQVRKKVIGLIRSAWVDDNRLPTRTWAQQTNPEVLALAEDPRIFNSWEIAMRIAGIPGFVPLSIVRTQNLFSKEKVVQWAHEFPAKHLTINFLLTHRQAWARAAVVHFGSINEALAQAGRPEIEFSEYPIPEAVEDLAGPIDTLVEFAGLHAGLSVIRQDRDRDRRIHRGFKARRAYAAFRDRLAQRTEGLEDPDAPKRYVSDKEILRLESQIEEILRESIRQLTIDIVENASVRDRHLVVERFGKIPDFYPLSYIISDPAKPELTLYKTVVKRTLEELRATVDATGSPPVSRAPSGKFQAVYEKLPWPEVMSELAGRQIFTKRAAAPGAEILVQRESDGSWRIAIQPGWAWSAGMTALIEHQDFLDLRWNAVDKTLSCEALGVAHLTSHHQPKRVSVKDLKLPHEPMVVLIAEGRRFGVYLHGAELPSALTFLRGLTGLSMLRLSWFFEDAAPSMVMAERYPPTASILLPTTSLRMTLEGAQGSDEGLKHLMQISYDRAQHKINMETLVDQGLRQLRLSEQDLLRAINKWSERYYGLQVKVHRESKDAPAELIFEAVRGDEHQLWERLSHAPIVHALSQYKPAEPRAYPADIQRTDPPLPEGLSVEPVTLHREIDGHPREARGEIWRVDLKRFEATQAWAENYRVRDLEKEFHSDNDPNVGRTIEQFVQEDPQSDRVVLAINSTQEHFIMNNTLLVHQGQWVMPEPQRRDLQRSILRRQARERGETAPEFTPAHGSFSLLSLDADRPGVFDVHVTLDGVPEGAPPVREGFAGPILLKKGIPQVNRLRFGKRPQYGGNDLNWWPNKRQAFSAFGYDADGLLVIVQWHGVGEEAIQADPNLEETLRVLQDHGVRDAILGGTSADVQRYSPHRRPEFVWTHAWAGSIIEKALGTSRGRRVGTVLKIKASSGATKTSKRPFPSHGSTIDPLEIHGANAYASFSDDWESLMHYLVQRDPLPDHADALLIFGSDDEQVPVAGAELTKRIPIDHVVVSGGQGKSTPPSWTEGEAVEYARIMRQYGVEPLVESRSAATWQNVKFSRDLLDKKGVTLQRVIVVQTPLAQRRALGDLKASFGPDSKVELFSWAPYHPSFHEAPSPWTLSEWRRRQLWEAFGEIARLLDYQRQGFIPKDPVPQSLVATARRIGRMLQSDASIPETDRANIETNVQILENFEKSPLKEEWTQVDSGGRPRELRSELLLKLSPDGKRILEVFENSPDQIFTTKQLRVAVKLFAGSTQKVVDQIKILEKAGWLTRTGGDAINRNNSYQLRPPEAPEDAGGSNHPETARQSSIPFPLIGSGSDPAKFHGPDAYEESRADWEVLKTYLAIRDTLPDHVDAFLVFGSDLEQVPEGAAEKIKTMSVGHVVVSGGKGRLTPPSWTDGEAVEYAKIMQRKGITPLVEARSATTWQNAQFSRKLLEEQGVDVKRVVVVQSALLQRRAFGDLKTAFKDRSDVELFAWAPYIPDFDKAPAPWSLAEWRRRQLFDAVGEITRLLDFQRQGFIPKNPVPQSHIDVALRLGERLHADDTIPNSARDVIRGNSDILKQFQQSPLREEWTVTGFETSRTSEGSDDADLGSENKKRYTSFSIHSPENPRSKLRRYLAPWEVPLRSMGRERSGLAIGPRPARHNQNTRHTLGRTPTSEHPLRDAFLELLREHPMEHFNVREVLSQLRARGWLPHHRQILKEGRVLASQGAIDMGQHGKFTPYRFQYRRHSSQDSTRTRRSVLLARLSDAGIYLLEWFERHTEGSYTISQIRRTIPLSPGWTGLLMQQAEILIQSGWVSLNESKYSFMPLTAMNQHSQHTARSLSVAA